MSPGPRLLTLAALCLALACGGCVTTTRYASTPPVATRIEPAAYFWDDLAPYGAWRQSGAYGWVWSPYGVASSWHPYSYGRWVYSDYGWSWASYWDWGAVPFHYGRWYYDAAYGWSWVPGSVWSPAWVAWRTGPGVIGWAPLPPSARWVPGAGVVFGVGGAAAAIGASWWVFTQPRYLVSTRLWQHSYAGGPALLRRTTPVVRYESGRHGVIHRGVDVREVERQARARVPRVSRQEVERSRRAFAVDSARRPATISRPDERQRRPRPPSVQQRTTRSEDLQRRPRVRADDDGARARPPRADPQQRPRPRPSRPDR